MILQEQLTTAHELLLQWALDFEILYCSWNPDQLHFICQCVHSLTHLTREIHRLGPLWLTSQWTMEHVIGYLGSLLRQPSNPFRNLAAQTRCVAHINVFVAMWPDFKRAKGNPQGSQDMGDRFLLLTPKDATPYELLPEEQMALNSLLDGYPDAEDIDRQAVY